MRGYLLLLFTLLAFSGCVNSQPQTTQSVLDRPAWILNPTQNGKIAAVGSAHRHYSGPAAQRKLAITRGLDELAMQQGVKVTLSMTKTEQMSNNKASVALDSQGSYDASASVSAHIEALWQDPQTQELFVWLILD